MLESLITSKTRLKLLVKFFVNENNQSHLRGLAEEFGESTNAIRKELNHLTEAGFLVKQSEKNKIEYKANTDHPLYLNLHELIRKYLGFDKLLEAILERMGNVSQVVVTGDYAKGNNTGVVTVDIVGEKLNEEYLEKLSARIEKVIQKKVEFHLNEGTPDPKGLVLYSKE
jgi:predicted transcriptional regulator